MTDKFKKVDKEYVLSDSSVNCYGYRLLTDGYQLAEFAKNPVGYYMHDRDGGVVVRWEDLRVSDDRVYGKPCINLSNARGQQTLDEAESGFLNAASVGHIVVLEYSLDETDMLEGQSGPTIVKWYNRECSLVDIPGNSNALTNLYDVEGNSLTLENLLLNTGAKPQNHKEKLDLTDMAGITINLDDLIALGLGTATKDEALVTLKNLKAQADRVPALEARIKGLEAASITKDVDKILAEALNAKKITKDLKATLATDYSANPTGLKALVDKMPAYQSVVSLIEQRTGNVSEIDWKWDDYERNDPSGKKLKALMTDNPGHYKALFDERFLK